MKVSVLIKGMEMPTACSKCDCGNGDYGFCQITRDSWWHIDPSTERMDNCPLVPIPDHGDLIDRDAYLDKLRTVEDDGVWMYAAAASVSVMPAVIPAERSEKSICDNCDERSDVGCSWCKWVERS